MKCPIDQTEMKEGKLGVKGSGWFVGWKEKNKWLGISKEMKAWRCPKCEKVELTTKEDN